MPRKTRVLHDEREYLFVDSPGDAAGPALLIFARSDDAKAVAPGRQPTHQSEHGLWCQIARFDGDELQLAPDPPAGLDALLKTILPRYVELRQEANRQAKNACWFLRVKGRASHVLLGAQPSGLVLQLFRSEEDAHAALDELRVEASVQSTGDLRQFLELRAEEGYAGAVLDRRELVFFCLDAGGLMQFVKVSPDADGRELASHLLAADGRWHDYEGDESLDPFVDQDAWDRLMVRVYGETPFVGFLASWRCFVLARGGRPVVLKDPDDTGSQRIVALFHDPEAAEAFRARHKLRGEVERVQDLNELLSGIESLGAVARLQPGDHRARGGALWRSDGSIVLDSFSGLWRSADGREFEHVE